MAFFKKLKDKLFKSSSKLDEGLEAIVADGGEEEAVEAVEAVEAGELVVEEAGPAEGSSSEPAPVGEGVVDVPAAPVAAPDLPPAPMPEPEPDVPPAPEPEPEPDVPPAPVPEPEPDVPPAPVPEPEPDVPPAPVPEPDLPPIPVPPAPRAEEAAAKRPGFIGRMLGRGEGPVMRRVLDDDMLESLEELLIAADMGVDTALRVTANMAEGRYGRKVSTAEIKQFLADEIARIMEPVARPMPLYPTRPQVVLVVGVNGSGKTTTIGKLASQFKAAGKSVVIAAGDTFRAAAVEQLQVWGQRAGVPVMTAPEGSDPASLAFDAMTKAQADGADLLMIDTAGRLQNRADLMEELSKIVRVIKKKDPDAPHNTLLVLDATTGQNALSQVDTFQKMADVSGLVMTKLDGTAKGGVLVALADKFGLPIHAIGVGEQIDDLDAFDPREFAEALTGAGA
ncbi:signal recognition particle-docking protein FtsY [Vannielia litorea]|uniref:signal recognition particle-docking protein FtsY n=1 Tax=Vannielia litorea TaxID=1217970 RepID=UPI001C955743|nr:signal recognition particle-docking protein FtsY [Vannielia litorea]MBY6046631.1 signal recognition particle-docking protein FtsY [Vannielia litorea]MBY6074045.1 signal recognition particle-docking protein FtsY [Vannielia litorea]